MSDRPIYKHKYYVKNIEKYKKRDKEYEEKNKNRLSARRKEYYLNNKEKLKNKSKKYRQSNRIKIRQYFNNRRKTDIQYKITENLRSRLNKALKGNFKAGSAVIDLGCTIQELKEQFEKQFEPGMTWENYGYYGWHIDHIKPLSYFDLTDRIQLLKACHYTNLQPLWHIDNFEKGNRGRNEK
jgi:hypothetical protein